MRHRLWPGPVMSTAMAVASLAMAPAVNGQAISTANRTSPPPHQLPAVAPAALDAISMETVNSRAQEIHQEADKPVRRPGSRYARTFAPQTAPPVLAPQTPSPGATLTNAPPAVSLTSQAFNAPAYRTPVTHPNEAEPSVAITKSGQVILVTANTFAALATDATHPTDHGVSFKFINPAVLFPQDSNKPFFCDQTVLYDAARDVMLWYMQHKYY